MNADEVVQFTLFADFHGKFKVPGVYLSNQMFNSGCASKCSTVLVGECLVGRDFSSSIQGQFCLMINSYYFGYKPQRDHDY